MANPEHLAILKQGVKAWNKWREVSPEVPPNLAGADLGEANLVKANLTGVDLTEANLSEAMLTEADLTEADLTWANLTEANLTKANLTWTYLTWANLSEADLTEAYVNWPELAATDFSGCGLAYTIFANADLSTAKGLETVKHHAPSTIGLDTFFNSQGKIPEVFLRGCGVPDIFLQYAASLAGKPIEFYSAFISYSSHDQALARRLHVDLQAKGVRCWFAPEDLKIGDRFRTEIDRAIRVHDKLLLLLSTASVASDWVEKEVESAFERERRDKRTILIPIRLDDAVMGVADGWAADIRRTRHIGDFTNWKDHDAYAKGFARLLRDLKAK